LAGIADLQGHKLHGMEGGKSRLPIASLYKFFMELTPLSGVADEVIDKASLRTEGAG
jgi:hypothetical protein